MIIDFALPKLKSFQVPFLLSSKIARPVIGYNVIEYLVCNNPIRTVRESLKSSIPSVNDNQAEKIIQLLSMEASWRNNEQSIVAKVTTRKRITIPKNSVIKVNVK